MGVHHHSPTPHEHKLESFSHSLLDVWVIQDGINYVKGLLRWWGSRGLAFDLSLAIAFSLLISATVIRMSFIYTFVLLVYPFIYQFYNRITALFESTFWNHAELDRGYRELLDGRLCRPDSEERPLVSNFTTVAIVKLCCHNFSQSAHIMIFFV